MLTGTRMVDRSLLISIGMLALVVTVVMLIIALAMPDTRAIVTSWACGFIVVSTPLVGRSLLGLGLI